ncbi:MAG: hypothetical protein AB7Q29_07385 [Vicinamibacterales bacterium]
MTTDTAALRQERDRVPRRVVYRAATGIAALLAIGALLTWLVTPSTSHGPGTPRPHIPAAAATYAASALDTGDRTLFEAQAPPSSDWAAKRQALESYEWVDRERGLAAIPIGRAMELIVEGAHVE